MIQMMFDLKWKKIPLSVTGAGIFIGVVLLFYAPSSSADIWMGLLPGICCLLFAKASQEAIGYGDGVLLCMMGLFYPIEELAGILVLAFGMAGITALVLLVVFKKKRKYEMAFVPFLVAAYVVDVWMKVESGYFG